MLSSKSAYAFGGDLGQFRLLGAVVSALFTSFYSWRLMFLTFWGDRGGNKHTHDHAHESPWTMLVPLGVLALGAVFAGMVWYGSFFGKTNYVAQFFGVPYAVRGGPWRRRCAWRRGRPWRGRAALRLRRCAGQRGAIHHAPDNSVLNDAHEVPNWVKVAPFAAMLIGLGMAWWFYILNPSIPGRLAQNQRPLYLFLLNKWYFDEIYNFAIVRPARWLGRTLWKGGDGAIIDGGINGLALGIIPFFTRLAGGRSPATSSPMPSPW